MILTGLYVCMYDEYGAKTKTQDGADKNQKNFVMGVIVIDFWVTYIEYGVKTKIQDGADKNQTNFRHGRHF